MVCAGDDPLDVPPEDGRYDSGAEAAELRSIWAGLAIPGAIDVHTHFMPHRVMEKVWAYFDRAGPLTGRPWPITYRHDDAARLEILASFGVLRFTSLVYPHKPDMAAWLNDWSLDFAARTPGCIPTATFFPEPRAGTYVDDAIRRGARVFKSHIQVGDYDPGDPLLDDVWGSLEDADIPTVIHAGSGPAPGRFTGPEPIEQLLRRFPRLRLIVAHMGLPEYREFLDIVERHDGVGVDTTMAFTRFTEAGSPFPHDEMSRLEALGDRVVFGSDFPNIPYRYLEAVRAILELDLGDAWMRGVFHDNALRILGP